MSIGEELKTELEQFGKETERKDKEKDKEEKAKKKSKGVGDKRIRIFWFASRFRDDNDKVLITEDRVINAIESHVTVESWGYIIHDNCVITQIGRAHV